jgi:uncharacterized protein YbaR (Trm112 family)
MKKSTVDILCCPVCKGDLVLRIVTELTRESAEDEILEGGLFCRKCGVEYPIREGIPDLLPRTGKNC